MSNTSALLGQNSNNPDANTKKSKDEEDLQERSTKKMNGGSEDRMMGSDGEVRDKSYRDTVMGRSGGCENEEYKDADEIGVEEGEWGEGMKVEERVIGNYMCPEFVFSKKEEKRIYRPWRRGVIVKLLGRRIGYKALETRLKQMWVRKGVISIIDVGNDYYLVAFTHEDDQYAALMDEPWFIYDHYLTVKEWSPNFHPASDTIEKVAVWVRISGLPIEYYDSKVLNFIGNRVGKTMKVDKNTLTQERGKYARLCVQVDLTKPLLAMFTIKGRKYNIEYEGLHMLCLTCGKFGHYKDGCPDKGKRGADQHRIESRINGGAVQPPSIEGNGDEGPWKVVHKQRRNRKSAPAKHDMTKDGKGNNIPVKQNEAPTGNNGKAKISGSRFIALSDDNCAINEEDMVREGMNRSDDRVIEISNVSQQNLNGINGKDSRNKGGHNGGNTKKGEVINEKSKKDQKLATRGGVFKGKNTTPVKKGVENLAEMMGVEWLDSLKAHYNKSMVTNGEGKRTEEVQKEMNWTTERNTGSMSTANVGREDANVINVPRPPNIGGASKINQYNNNHHETDTGLEVEIFEDADDQGSMGISESDMEVVQETPYLEQ
jgi:hypothetical protein